MSEEQQDQPTKKLVVTVDRDACASCGNCTAICPAAFELDDEGISVVKEEGVVPENYEAIREAADSCPSQAIIIKEVGPTAQPEEPAEKTE